MLTRCRPRHARWFARSLGGARRRTLPCNAGAWANVADALAAAGSSIDRLVKLTVFGADAADFAVFDSIRRAFIDHDLPAIECVAAPFPGASPRSVIQIDAVAHAG